MGFYRLKVGFFLLPLLIAAVFLAAFPLAAFGDDGGGTAFLASYVQTLYDDESAIPVSQVKSALQTANGYMWFAGYQGLMRYDGINTKIFAPEDGFPTYNVNTLFEDSRSRLLIGTNDSGLVLYENYHFSVFGLDSGLPSASVRDLCEDEMGNIFIATAGGVASFSPAGEIIPHPELTQLFIIQIEYLGDGRFVCLVNDGTVILFDRHSIIHVYGRARFGTDSPLSLYLSKESGVLYIGTAANKLVITDRFLGQPRTISLPARHTINSFYEDSRGRLWICADNGLGYLDGLRFIPVDGLNMTNSIETIYEDYEGNYWVTSSRQGLLQLSAGTFKNLLFAARLPDYTVNATAVYQGDLYIGADEGLVILRDNAELKTDLSEMLMGVRIRSLLADSQGQLWICTYDQYGVIILKPDGQILWLNESHGLASNKTRCIIEAADGSMIVGTGGGVSIIRGQRVVKSYGKDEGLTNDVILCLAQGGDGSIYAGSDGGGIYVIKGDKIINYSEKDGLPAGVILRMAPFEQGLWISTGNALCYMDETGIRFIDKLMAYDDSIFDILQIGGELWLLQSKGLNICEIDNLLSADELKITQFQRRDGLIAPITANSWHTLSDEGLLYICTGRGVLSVEVSSIHQSSVTPHISIAGIRVDGQLLDLSQELVLPSDTQRVEIYGALLSYESKDGTISYILEGFDNQVKTINRRDAHWLSYTNLKAGEYTFRLSGTNAAGAPSEEITLELRKEYTALETPLLRMFLVLLAAGLLIFIVWYVVSRGTKTLARQKQEYKDITGQAISVIAALTDSRNEYTAGHSRRVAKYSQMIGLRLGLSEEDLETLGYSALLHDIGKISVPDSITNKRQALNKHEYGIIKNHVTIGGDLLSPITIIEDIALGARYHHERIDGSGYVEGLRGEEIPLFARIISVANACDSMLSDRPYRKALSLKELKSEFVHNAGTQFDERIVAILIELIDEGAIPL